MLCNNRYREDAVNGNESKRRSEHVDSANFWPTNLFSAYIMYMSPSLHSIQWLDAICIERGSVIWPIIITANTNSVISSETIVHGPFCASILSDGTLLFHRRTTAFIVMWMEWKEENTRTPCGEAPTSNLSKRIAANDPYSLLHRSHFLLPSPDKMSQWLLMLYVYLYRFLCKRAVPLTNNCLWEPDATRKLVYLSTCFHFSVVTFRAHFSKFFFAPLWWILLDCWLRFATVSTGCVRQWYVRKGRPRTHCQELGQCKWFASH